MKRTKHALEDGTPFDQEGLRRAGWKVDVFHLRVDNADYAWIKEIVGDDLAERANWRNRFKAAVDSAVRSKKDIRARADDNPQSKDYELSPRAGKTVVNLTDPSGKQWTHSAYCSLMDVYRNQIGYLICMGKLAKQTGNLRRR